MKVLLVIWPVLAMRFCRETTARYLSAGWPGLIQMNTRITQKKMNLFHLFHTEWICWALLIEP